MTCSIKTDPKIDFCETRKKRTLATVVDDDGFPRYNFQEGRTDTKESFKNHVTCDADIDEFWKMLITFLSFWPHICHQHLSSKSVTKMYQGLFSIKTYFV